MRKKHLKLILGSLAAFLLLGWLAFYKITQAPEWSIMTGSPAERAAACRAIWQKSDARAQRGLQFLLQDPAEVVRMAALEAVIRKSEQGPSSILNNIDPLVFKILKSDTAPANRVKAGRYLLSRVGQTAEVAEQWLYDKVKSSIYCQRNSGLLQHVFLHQARTQNPVKLDWAVKELLRGGKRYSGLADLVLLYPAELEEYYKTISLAVTETSPRSGTKEFALSALRVIHERRRKENLDSSTTAGNQGNSSFLTEAEWAYDIKPNYQIEAHDGQLTLHLGEGAGGYNDWLQGDDSTVDIGTGKFTFNVGSAGYYRLWVRIFMENKCGNSTGMYIDGQQVGRFSDSQDRFDQWIWMPSHRYAGTGIYLNPGEHQLKVKAFEDGVYVDKYALLPAYEELDPKNLPARQFLYDAALPTSVSIRFEAQHMERGTSQNVTVWVRRNRPAIESGTVLINVPKPFELHGRNQAKIQFEKDNPIASATFKLSLPKDAVAGEVEVSARFLSDMELAEGSTSLGAHYDWLTTGPLDPYSARAKDLKEMAGINHADLLTGWKRFPSEGYDRYRRLDFEKAYGESQDKYIFLYTEIEVEESGEYLGLLTLDDSGFIWLDGHRVEGRVEDLQGEGRLMMTRYYIDKGRHQVFVRIYQADFPDPDGEDADRETYNNWNFKWLLRKERHEIAPGIKGVPINLDAANAKGNAPAFPPE